MKVLQQLYALGFRLISHEVNMTVSIFDLKERQGQVFVGEEPVRHQGLPRLPRGRPHERLCLELS